MWSIVSLGITTSVLELELKLEMLLSHQNWKGGELRWGAPPTKSPKRLSMWSRYK